MNTLIPIDSKVFQTIDDITKNAKIVAFSGLPGVGKSLYINQFHQCAQSNQRSIDVIQWDVARKAFETPEISKIYPIENDTVHNGVKLSVGQWLIDFIDQWLIEHSHNDRILLIEAPLVGHRFVEIAKECQLERVEEYLSSDQFKVIVPIPTKEVRAKIEDSRKAQVSEDAEDWSGAKPSVMLMLWKMICGIANKMGRSIPMDGQPDYDPEVYQFVFSSILKHRHVVPLIVDEIFEIPIDTEDALHSLDSISPSSEVAAKYVVQTQELHPTDSALDDYVATWYLS